jgi:hypothetical protein
MANAAALGRIDCLPLVETNTFIARSTISLIARVSARLDPPTEGYAKGLIFGFIVVALRLCNTFCTPEVNDGPDRFRARVPAAAFD